MRLWFIVAFAFFDFLMIFFYSQSEAKGKAFLFVLGAIVFTVCGLLWIYTQGVFINRKNNKLKIVVGISKRDRYERVLSDIQALDVEKVSSIGMKFIMIHQNGSVEKIEYKFYRISFFEEAQFKRMKRQLRKILEK